MQRLGKALSILAAMPLIIGHAAPRPPEHPVKIGHDGLDFDACGGVGEVTGLDPKGDNFLALRSRPAPTSTKLAEIGPRKYVWICDGEGDWIGIVFDHAHGNGPGDCGVSSPAESLRAYDGPCQSGWVHKNYITLIAG